MREVKTDKGTILVNESIKELPISRYTDFNKYIIQDTGIGSDVHAIMKHFALLDSFLAAGKIDDARRERLNLHFNFVVAINKINITHISFAVLIKSINGQAIDDYSERGLERVCQTIGEIGVGRQELEGILSDVKKKLISS